MSKLERILIEIFKQRNQDDKVQEALNNLVDLIAPFEYAPILEGKATGMLEIIGILNPALYEELSYFLYEAPSFYEDPGYCEIEDKDGKHIITCDTQAIVYLLKNYNEL